MTSVRVALIWAALVVAISGPNALAMTSDLLKWRGTVYILAGFAGIFALGLLLVQPLLIAGYLPGFSAYARGAYTTGPAARWSRRWESTLGVSGSQVRRTCSTRLPSHRRRRFPPSV